MFTMGSLFKDLLAKVAVKLTTVTNGNTVTTGTNIIDCLNVDRVLLAFWTGTITDGDYALSVAQGDESNLSDYAGNAIVEDTDTNGDLPAFTADSDDDKVLTVEILPRKRYIRVDITQSNGSSGGIFGCLAFLHRVRNPVNSDVNADV